MQNNDEWITKKSKKSIYNNNKKRSQKKINYPSLSLSKYEFQLVPIIKNNKSIDNSNNNDDENFNVKDFSIKCENLSLILEKSDFFILLIKNVDSIITPQCFTLITLGIGQICSSPSSLLQFALILCIKKEYESRKNENENEKIINEINLSTTTTSTTNIDINIKIFDPLFSYREIELCKLLQLEISDENKKGKHFADSKHTLFFMPHCPYRLYVNLLWENWNNLENIIILGNR